MHIYFSGIGGTGIGPLALIAHQAGFTVSGSDKQHSLYIDYLQAHGVTNIHIGQDYASIAAVHTARPIDWLVFSSAVAIEQPNAPEFLFCKEHAIRQSARDELIVEILKQKKLNMLAIAGTHGKSTTTAMAVWLFKQLGIPISYSFGAKTSFSDMGSYEKSSKYFVYEADEFARNFLTFHPTLSIIVGIDYDHPDIYPTKQSYDQAFRDFINQSAQTIMWDTDFEQLGTALQGDIDVLQKEHEILNKFTLIGEVNRQNAYQVAYAVHKLTHEPLERIVGYMNKFPGLARRFERLLPNLYSDYAHTPPKIRGAIQTAHEAAGNRKLIVVYEGLHNTRQHFIKDELVKLFDSVDLLYIVPSYLAREDESLEMLSPEKLRNLLSNETRGKTIPSQLDENLKTQLLGHLTNNELVLCLTAGGGNSLDEWLRQEFIAHKH